MTSPADHSSTTDSLHADRRFGVEHGGIHKPIHTSVQYGFDRVEDLIGTFQGTLKGNFNYARQGTPTTAALEAKITQLEQGRGTVSFATGMAAITGIFLTLLRAGDHIVSSRYCAVPLIREQSRWSLARIDSAVAVQANGLQFWLYEATK